MKLLNSYSKSERQKHPKCGKSMTEQHHKKSCDINTILAKYQETGLIDHVTRHQGAYGDVTGADYQNAMNLIAEQKSIFHELPAAVRRQFGDDPANYLDLVCQPDGLQTLSNMLNPAVVEPESEEQPETAEKDGEQEEKPVT